MSRSIKKGPFVAPELIKRVEELHKAGVGVPPVTEVLQYLKGRRLPLQDRVRTVNEAVASIYDSLRGNDHAH